MKCWPTRPIQTFTQAAPRTRQHFSKDALIWSLNLDQIESHGGRVLEKVFVSADKLGPSTFAFEPRTVLYSKLRPYLNKVVVADEAGFATTELVPLRCDPDEVHPEYLAYFLRSEDFLRFATDVVAGAKMPRMVMSEFWNYQVPLPPISEQRRIAAILDQTDALRTKRREAMAQLECLKQSIFIEMFEGADRGEGRWRVCTVGELSDCIVPGRDKPKSFSGGIPWVTTSDLIHLGVTSHSEKGMGLSAQEIEMVNARVIPNGSVIISCVGDLGIVSIAGTSMVVNQQLHSFQCHPELNNVFLMYCLARQKAFMLAKASSTTLPYMNKSVCNSIPVFLPPLTLQQSFASRIQKIETIKACQQAALIELDKLFSALQQRAFSGEL